MKLKGTVTSIEILRGGTTALISFGQEGAIVMRGMDPEERQGLRAGDKVDVDVQFSVQDAAPVSEGEDAATDQGNKQAEEETDST